MLFNTFDFAVFLPAVIILYFLIPHRFRWVLLLFASYFFYMCWKVEYIVLIIASTLVDFLCGIRMEKMPTRKKRRPYLILSLMTFILVSFIWVFFRSQSFGDAMLFFKSLVSNLDLAGEALAVPLRTWILLALFMGSDVWLYNTRFDQAVSRLAVPFRWAIYAFLIFSIIAFAGVENFAFIYFQF